MNATATHALETRTETIPARKHRPEKVVESRTFHLDPRCPHITGEVVPVEGNPGDAWDCDYCGDANYAIELIDPAERVALVERAEGAAGRSTGRRRNQYGDARVPSEKQAGFYRSLLARKCGLNDEGVDYIVALAKERNAWTKRGLIGLIDELLAMPDPESVKAVAPELSIRKNNYPGTCRTCGQPVAAEAGRIEKLDGRWVTFHLDGECPVPAPAVEPPTEGMHRLDNGRIFKVQVAHHGSGNLYAKELITHGHGHAEFVYTPGAIKLLSAGTKMTLEQAREYGALYGVCCQCGATLTDEKSIAAGIGPVCARKFR